MANGDQFGNAVPLSQDAFGQPQELEKAKKPGLLGRLEKWYTTPTQDLPPLGKGGTHAPGEPAPQPTFSTPQEKTRASLASAGIMAAPLMAPALAAAPAATVLGLGGGLVGGTAGSVGGRYLGERYGAPELGSDVGGFTGSVLGGGVTSRIPGMAKNALVDVMGRPKPLARLALGGERASALGELVNPEVAASRSAMQARFDALRAGQTAPGPWRPGMRPPPMAQTPPPEVFPVSKSPGPYRGPSSVPEPEPLQGRPTLFPRGTSSANPPATPLSQTGSVLGNQPKVELVPKFAPPEPPRIVSSESAPSPFKVTYQSVPQRELYGKIMQGDTEAVREWQRRGLELPTNVRYLTEPGAPTVPWRNLEK